MFPVLLHNVKVILPDIHEFHVRYIAQSLAGDERQQHGVSHVSMITVGNVENLLPFFQREALPGNSAPRLLRRKGRVITRRNLAEMLYFLKYVRSEQSGLPVPFSAARRQYSHRGCALRSERQLPISASYPHVP